MGPHLQSSKCQPDNSLEAGSSRQLSHEHVIEPTRGCLDFYHPMDEYMKGLGEDNDRSHLCLKDQFVYHFLLPLFVSFLSIEHQARTRILRNLLDWIHWKSDFT